jgi:energy-coupling factor transporter ATP-binding protein EcfA2/ABC-type multidrug transport system permease subunit
LLGLAGSDSTIIGDASMKGVSGGERKRVAVGMQLISDPSLLFLDEPTSGLDTLNAFNVVSTLKTLACKGKTVLATLHQPSSEIFHMMDDLIVMAAGEIVYCGPAAAAVHYFGTLGFECPMYSNPGDFIFMQVLNLQKQAEIAMKHEDGVGGSALEVASQQLELSQKWSASVQNQEMLSQCSNLAVTPISNISTNFQAVFATQFLILMQRAWKNALRNPLLVKAKIGQAMFMAVLLGLIYQGDGMKTHQAGIQNRTGVIFFMAINQVIITTIFPRIYAHMYNAHPRARVIPFSGNVCCHRHPQYILCGEAGVHAGARLGHVRNLLLHRAALHPTHALRRYGMTAYFVSKVMVELPFSILTPFLFAVVSYFFVGLDNSGAKFIIFAALCVLSSNCGVSIGMASTCLVSNLPTALAIMPLFLLPIMLFGGNFVNNGLIPPYLDWLKYISPIKYSYHAAMQNELAGLQFYCRDFEYTRVNGQVSCARTKGDDVLKLMELTDLSIGGNIAALFGLWFGYLLLAYVALVKTSSAPSGTSRFPRNDRFVPSIVLGGAQPPAANDQAQAPQPSNTLPSSTL